MSDYETRAQRARGNAVHTYLGFADEALFRGDWLYEIDPNGARAVWLDGMVALDAAIEAAKGLELEDKSA